MCKAAGQARRTLGLEKSLLDRINEQCSLVHMSAEEANIPDVPVTASAFRPKPCLGFGVCVCGTNRDAKHLSDNCKRLFRNIFWKKKKENRASPLRLALEGLQVFVEFRRPVSVRPPPGAGAFSSSEESQSDDWAEHYHQNLHVETSSPESLHVHLGRVNLKTFHFSALRMQETFPLPDELPAGVRWLHPYSHDEDAEQVALTDMEVFVRLLDLKLPWTMKFHLISSNPLHWRGAPVEEVAVVDTAEQPPVVVWQGTTEEAARRSVLEASKRAVSRRQAPPPKRNHARPAAGDRARAGRRGKRGQGGAAAAVDADQAQDAEDLEAQGRVYDSDGADADVTEDEQQAPDPPDADGHLPGDEPGSEEVCRLHSYTVVCHCANSDSEYSDYSG